MPFIRISTAGTALSARQIEDLQQRTTDLMVSVLGKRRELTSVLVEQPASCGWAIGGTPAPLAAHLDAKITEGTNTPSERSAFIAEAMAMLRDVLGAELDLRTYVVVDELRGDAWGYGGLTQDHRRESAPPASLAR